MEKYKPTSVIKNTLKRNLDLQNPSVNFHQAWQKAQPNNFSKRFNHAIVPVGILLLLTLVIFIYPTMKKSENVEMISQSDKQSTSQMIQDSTDRLLFVNGNEYVLDGDIRSKEYTQKAFIGVVNNKIEDNEIPKDNFSSNMLNVGDSIYSTNEDPTVLLVIQKDGSTIKFIKTNR